MVHYRMVLTMMVGLEGMWFWGVEGVWGHGVTRGEEVLGVLFQSIRPRGVYSTCNRDGVTRVSQFRHDCRCFLSTVERRGNER